MIKNSLIFYVFILFFSFSFSQSALNDCTGAIEVCGDGTISSNASGFGLQEIDQSNSCASFEHNSLWIKIKITKSGTLGFNLIPTSASIDVDYDFFVFGPNSTCENLGNSIRCSTTNPIDSGQDNNHTGMKDEENDLSEGPGPHGNSFVKSLDVSPGETYFIVIDRPIGQSAFQLEWTGTSTVGGSPFPEGVEVNKPDDLVKCGINGSAEFDILQTQNEINNQPQTIIEYYKEFTDAIDQNNPILGNFVSTVPRKSIFVRVENPLTGCFEITDFDLIILEDIPIEPNLEINICDWNSEGFALFNLDNVKPDILNGLPPENYRIKYFETLNGALMDMDPIPSIYSSTGGTIFARVEDGTDTECYNISVIQLELTSLSDLNDQVRENLQFGSLLNKIKITFPGFENYEFALNNSEGPYQDNPVFENLNAGNYTVFIRNKTFCEMSFFQVSVLGFKNFFTPNQDGFNDFWDFKIPVELIGEEPIKIFDRYGKLLIQIFPNSMGWDGTFKGKKMPADDYWFDLILNTGERLRGNFSLLR